ncbi:MAG: hypothetical protein GX055_01765 [Desulfovibrionales bacterium]|nr:hypothetical protein [Desulfovibrionales bacterium]
MFAEIPLSKLLVALPILFVPIIPNLWAIWHIHRHEFATAQERMAWLVAQIILPVLGGLGYLFIGRHRAQKK